MFEHIKVKIHKPKKDKHWWIRTFLFWLIIIAIGAVSKQCYASASNIISDYNYTNQNYTLKQMKAFCRSFANNKLTDEDIYFIYYQCRYNEINALVALLKIEGESSLISNPPFPKSKKSYHTYDWRKNRAMGYARYIWKDVRDRRYCKYEFYQPQVMCGIQTLRKWFDHYKKGKRIKLLCVKKWVYPVNAASYSLLTYNPFYGVHNIYGWDYNAIGNLGLERDYKKYKKLWGECK